jgi:hypothetical protein
MSRNGSGTYTLPANSFSNPVAGTEIDAEDADETLTDIETALTASIAKDGQTTTTARIPFAAGIQVTNTGLGILDTNASHLLSIVPGSNITADRALTITTGDANRGLTLSADLTVSAATTVGGTAVASDINTGTDATKIVTADALAGSNLGIRYGNWVAFAPDETCATGDGAAMIPIPAGLNGMNLVEARAHVVTAGTTNTMDIQIRRKRSGSSVDMLSTKITVNSTELFASDGVINASNDDVATDDQIFIDVDAVHTTPAVGLVVVLGFQLP